MFGEIDLGDGPMIGTQGNSKLVFDAIIDGAVIVLSAAIPPGAPFIAAGATALKGVGVKLQEHQERNVHLMMVEGQKEAGLTADAFLAAVTSDPERLLPFVSACEAARRTALDEKVRALGRAVGGLATDAALVDESTIWINVFSQVDAPHVRMVAALCDRDPENEGYLRLWTRQELQERCGLTATVSVVVNTLTSLGLMREVPYEELTQHDIARWGVSRPGLGGSPVYTKGPLTNDFLQRLGTADEEA